MAKKVFGPLDLWDFQKEDLDSLDPNMEDYPNILLAWEMGTGKTFAGIERDRRIRKRYETAAPTLVVAPLATHDAWENWFKTLTPLKVACINPKDRQRLLTQRAHVYIVHWEALRLMPKLIDFGFQHVIADEVHRAKNRRTKQTRALKKIRTKFKTGLSGTPADNQPHDLWSVLNWLYPRKYTSFWDFYKKYVDFDIIYPHGYHQINGPKNHEHLLREIAPFYRRRLKEDVLKDLPPKVYEEIWVELDPKQRRAYDAMKQEMIAWIGEHEDMPVVASVVIAQLNRLMQFALAYIGWDEEQERYVMTEPSAKLDALMQLLSDNPTEQMVIFSQWKSPLNLLAQRLEKANIPYAMYTGDETNAQRQASKAKFVSGEARLLLSTVRAGGEGVDGLQRASATVVFLDRDWSQAKNLQAEDRLHRGGQVEQVTVIDIRARNTVDLGRKQRLIQKWDWIKTLLGDK